MTRKIQRTAYYKVEGTGTNGELIACWTCNSGDVEIVNANRFPYLCYCPDCSEVYLLKKSNGSLCQDKALTLLNQLGEVNFLLTKPLDPSRIPRGNATIG